MEFGTSTSSASFPTPPVMMWPRRLLLSLLWIFGRPCCPFLQRSSRFSRVSLHMSPSKNDGVDITHLYTDSEDELTIDDMQQREGYRSGFITILGNPNVGKSTLMNQILGEKLSIVTHKAQTTRHRIRGILTTERFQMIYSDTPGLLNPRYKLHEGMMKFVNTAIKDADVVLVVVDPWQDDGFQDNSVIDRIKLQGRACFVAINKVDALLKGERMPGAAKAGEKGQPTLDELITLWQKTLPSSKVMPISALQGTNTTVLLEELAAALPEGPMLFPSTSLTDRPERFFASEIIREKILLLYADEIPYSCEVAIESFKDSDQLLKIQAVVYCARDSQKGILIGKQGASIKKLGTSSRETLEEFFSKKVMLETRVKVAKNWRSNEDDVRRFGYFDD